MLRGQGASVAAAIEQASVPQTEPGPAIQQQEDPEEAASELESPPDAGKEVGEAGVPGIQNSGGGAAAWVFLSFHERFRKTAARRNFPRPCGKFLPACLPWLQGFGLKARHHKSALKASAFRAGALAEVPSR